MVVNSEVLYADYSSSVFGCDENIGPIEWTDVARQSGDIRLASPPFALATSSDCS